MQNHLNPSIQRRGRVPQRVLEMLCPVLKFLLENVDLQQPLRYHLASALELVGGDS